MWWSCTGDCRYFKVYDDVLKEGYIHMMPANISSIFKSRKMNSGRLTAYGFREEGGAFFLTKPLRETDFVLTVTVYASGEVSTLITDTAVNEPYTLHLAGDAVGSFVGSIRQQYEEILADVAKYCFDSDIFKKEMSKEVIAFVRKTYGDELEFLWASSPGSAVLRRKDTGKWYAVLLTVCARKLGIDSDEIIEILDFRVEPDELQKLLARGVYYPGWHMNKKHWCTVVLDGSVALEDICERLQVSYALAIK